ncbi:hypothetical protein HRQ91_04720 [Treponema parvum]|uniref:Uncharacterized protein n=1 Tax=Treponema parvum TaxID=138851 RepID=A0A975F3R4_9SPIR|nr:hypothetical protein [Treponema parvum]QTQ13817.1 hypothetical protein HRQ91_04720 [Treponema parvum]
MTQTRRNARQRQLTAAGNARHGSMWAAAQNKTRVRRTSIPCTGFARNEAIQHAKTTVGDDRSIAEYERGRRVIVIKLESE